MIKVLIVSPVFLRTEKTINFLSSLMGKDYGGIDLKVCLGINKASEGLVCFINAWAKQFESTHTGTSVIIKNFTSNQGKGKALNYLVENFSSKGVWEPDFICSIDSDVVQIQYKWMKRLIEIFHKFKEFDGNRLGLVSPNLLEDSVSCNIHTLEKCNGSVIYVGNYPCTYTQENSGIAGPCFMISNEAWKSVGGYYDALYIGGNDAYMLQDMWRKGYRALVSNDLYVIHPRPTAPEEQYTRWKHNMVEAARSKPATLPDGMKDFETSNIDL